MELNVVTMAASLGNCKDVSQWLGFKTNYTFFPTFRTVLTMTNMEDAVDLPPILLTTPQPLVAFMGLDPGQVGGQMQVWEAFSANGAGQVRPQLRYARPGHR